MLKNILKSTSVALFMGIALWSCSGGGDLEHSRYVPVKLTGESNWSILDTHSGEILCQGDFERKPSAVVDGKFIVKTRDRKCEMYDISDPKSPLNKTEFSQLGMFNDCDVTIAVKEGRRLSIIDKDFEVVKELPSKIKRCGSYFSNGLVVYETADGKTGFLDEDSNEAIPAKYDYASPSFVENYNVVGVSTGSGMKYSIIDKKGEVKASFNSEKYELVNPEFHNGLIVVKKGDKIVFLNENGEEEFTNSKFEYSECYAMDDGMTVFHHNGNYGLMDKNGEVKIRAKYDGLAYAYPDRYIAELDGKSGIIDSKGETVLDFDKMELFPLSDNSSVYFAWAFFSILVDEDGEPVIGDTVFSDIGDAGIASTFQMLHSEAQ